MITVGTSPNQSCLSHICVYLIHLLGDCLDSNVNQNKWESSFLILKSQHWCLSLTCSGKTRAQETLWSQEDWGWLSVPCLRRQLHLASSRLRIVLGPPQVVDTWLHYWVDMWLLFLGVSPERDSSSWKRLVLTTLVRGYPSLPRSCTGDHQLLNHAAIQCCPLGLLSWIRMLAQALLSPKLFQFLFLLLNFYLWPPFFFCAFSCHFLSCAWF